MTQLTTVNGSNQQQIFTIIDKADLADTTKMQYKKAVANYLATGASLTDAEALANYAATLPQSSRAFLKSAIKKWSDAMMVVAKGQATPENIDAIQAVVYRFEALQESINVKTQKGQKAHTWLSQKEVRQLMALPDQNFLIGKRDKIALGLCVSAGLRRAEAVAITFDDLELVPIGDGFRTVINVPGKGAKDRPIPIRSELANDIQMWRQMVGGGGLIIRSLGRGSQLGDSLTAVSLFRLVNRYGKKLAKSLSKGDERREALMTLAPHDLRRSYAQLGFEAGVPVTQISILLGHADIATTQRYLNLDLDVETTISDFVPY